MSGLICCAFYQSHLGTCWKGNCYARGVIGCIHVLVCVCASPSVRTLFHVHWRYYLLWLLRRHLLVLYSSNFASKTHATLLQKEYPSIKKKKSEKILTKIFFQDVHNAVSINSELSKLVNIQLLQISFLVRTKCFVSHWSKLQMDQISIFCCQEKWNIISEIMWETAFLLLFWERYKEVRW